MKVLLRQDGNFINTALLNHIQLENKRVFFKKNYAKQALRRVPGDEVATDVLKHLAIQKSRAMKANAPKTSAKESGLRGIFGRRML